jgi:hypothetical protein
MLLLLVSTPTLTYMLHTLAAVITALSTSNPIALNGNYNGYEYCYKYYEGIIDL